jgi:hypothetical protein
VQIEESSGVTYADDEGRVFLDAEGRVFLEAEWLVDGVRMRLDSPRSCGLEFATRERVAEVVRRIVRGLRFLGYQCEATGRVRGRWKWFR